MKRLFRLVLILPVIAAIAAGLFYRRIAQPYRGFQADEVFVDLPAGTRQADIARRLADAGVVPDPWTFQFAVRLAGAGRRLQAGEYKFSAAASPREVVARLAHGDVYRRGVTFPEGLTIREMAPIVERAGLGSADDFVRIASDGALAAPFDPGARTLEGYLFPSTYAMPHQASASEVARAMVAQFEKVFDGKLRASAEQQHMTTREVVTLASLIEKESASPEERPMISGVYRNRLRVHMPLQCDPTVIYALMVAGRWNGNIKKEDLQIDSPYNTYRYPGLPPGPIASPGRTSLEAAVHPADVPYLYFVSRNNGTHVFASSLEEHNRYVAQFQKKVR
jgi:UPF0755 protein